MNESRAFTKKEIWHDAVMLAKSMGLSHKGEIIDDFVEKIKEVIITHKVGVIFEEGLPTFNEFQNPPLPEEPKPEGLPDFSTFNNMNEATTSWSKLMKAVKSGVAPYSLVVIDPTLNYPKGKVVKQEINIQIPDIIPAQYEALRKEFPNAIIYLEDSEGTSLWGSK